MIRIEGLAKSFGDNHVLRGIDCTIADGEVVVVVGRSGSGKSTFLRCINRMEEPSAGQVWLDDVEVTSEKTNLNHVRGEIGMVFQQFNLFPHLTTLENVALAPMRVKKMPRVKAEQIAMEKLREVGLEGKAHEHPRRLSGGQKQRVAIARALAMQPRVMLFDEPTSALDPESVGEVLGVMRRLASEGMTMIIVSHEMKFAREVASRMLFLDGGRIIEEGVPSQLMDAPQHDRVKKFFDKI